MSCCGQQRAALRAQFQAAAPVVAVPPVLLAPVALVHASGTATVVRGAHTGVVYLFGAERAVLEVDSRDAPALLAGGRFLAVATSR